MQNIFARERIASSVAEFFGTGVLVLVFLSVKNSQIGVPFFVALGAGLTVALMILAVGRVAGAHMNPAITLGLWTARKVGTVPAVLAVVMQLLGAWAAYGLFTYIVNTSLPDPNARYSSRTLVVEAVGAGILAFGWSAALYQGYTRAVTAASAGLAYVVGLVSVSVISLAYLNPAVALGSRSWVWGSYVLGPVLGAVIGTNLYALLFAGATPLAEARTVAEARADKPSAAKTRAAGRAAAKKPAAKRSSGRGRK